MFYPPEGQGVEKIPFLFGSEAIKLSGKFDVLESWQSQTVN